MRNDLKKIIEKENKGEFEDLKNQKGIEVLQIYHDDWCDFLKGMGNCNCDPDVIRKKEVQ